MNRKFVVLSRGTHLYGTRRLNEEAKRCGVDLQNIDPYDLWWSCQGDVPLVDALINRCTGAMRDEYDLVVAHSLAPSERVFNSVECARVHRSKLVQMQYYHSKGHPIIPTFALRGVSKLDVLMDQIQGEEFIVKTEFGNQGRGVNVVRGKDSLIDWCQTLYWQNNQQFIIQPKIEAREMRALVLNGKILGYLNKDDQKSKWTFDAQNSLFDQFVGKVFAASGCFYGAVDFLVNDQGLWLLEVNISPGFEMFESLSSINVAAHLLEEIKKALN